jgi:hypothetical protein
VLLGDVSLHVPTWPDGQSFIFRWGAVGWGEGHPGQRVYTFVIHILSTSRTYSKFQHSLFAVTLGTYLSGSDATPPEPEVSEKGIISC